MMKKFFYLVFFLPTITLASPLQNQYIEIEPGSKVTINANEPTVVSCAQVTRQEDETLPRCEVKSKSFRNSKYDHMSQKFTVNEHKKYFILSGSDKLGGDYDSFEDAVKMIPQLRESGLCR